MKEQIIEVLGSDIVGEAELINRLIADPALSESPSQIAKALVEVLGSNDDLLALRGGRVWIPGFVTGMSFPLRVEDDGSLRADGFASVLRWWLIDRPADLVDETGSRLGAVHFRRTQIDGRNHDVIHGPTGWLDGLAGSWVELSVVDPTSLRLSVIAAPSVPTAAQVAAFRSVFDEVVMTREGTLPDGTTVEFARALDVLVRETSLAADREAFLAGSVPDFSELIEAAGVELRDTSLAEHGFDWDGFESIQRLRRLASVHGLERAGVDALIRLITASTTSIGAEEPPADPGELCELFELVGVAKAFVAEVSDEDPAAVLGFLDSLASAAVAGSGVDADESGMAGSHLEWARAELLDRSGDAISAWQIIAALIERDPVINEVLIKSAGFSADRSDPMQTVASLMAAGVMAPEGHYSEADANQRMLIEAAVFGMKQPKLDVGRNDRCPCGSGRKYKVCHLRNDELMLTQRAPWLYQKAIRWAAGPGDPRSELALAMSQHDRSQLVELRDSPAISDLVLHEAGAFGAFVQARSAILPADEVDLAASWLGVERSVFEVTSFGEGWLELQGAAGGDPIIIGGLDAAEMVLPSRFVVCRPLPVLDRFDCYGGVMFLDPDAVETVNEAIATKDAPTVATAIGRSQVVAVRR